MFVTRALSGFFLILAISSVICTGGDILWLVLSVISVIGLNEFYHVTNIRNKYIYVCGYLATIVYWGMIRLVDSGCESLIFSLIFISFMGMYVLNFEKTSLQEIVMALIGIFYISGLFTYLYKIRILENGFYYIWLVFIGAWGCDTFAYCGGKLFGKHKLTPVLSPKKSIEGSIAGCVGATILGFLYAAMVKEKMPMGDSLTIFCGAVSFIISVVSQIGDLSASAIKRTYGAKDYGKLIPGHGGILDRFDSILFAAPIVYVFIKLFV